LLEERPMNFLTILVLALSSNLDNVGVGLAYGTRKVCLPFLSNLIIALITSCGTLITMLMGKDRAVLWLKGPLADYLGGGIIVIAGLYVLIQSFQQQTPVEEVRVRSEARGGGGFLSRLKELGRMISDPELADRDYSGCIEAGEAVVLGLALTLNNLANGFAAGMLGLSPAMTTGAVFIFSLLTFWIGILLGRRFSSQIWGEWAGHAAGVMLILLGIYEMFQ
jgi:putative sporulation protein YtaF